MLRILFTLVLALSAVPFSAVLAAPPHRCDGWGWPGFQMGDDRWGVVLTPSKSSGKEVEVINPCNSSSNSSSASSSPTPTSSIISTEHITTLKTTMSFTTFTFASSSSVIETYSSSASGSSSSTSLTPSSESSSTPVITSTKISTSSSAPSSSPVATTSSTPVPASPSSSKPAPSTSSTSSSEAASSTSNTLSSSGSSSGSSGSNGSKASNSDVQAYLSAHNNVRAQHGASPLAWNNTLAAAAQKWSDGCVFQHSGGKLGPFGENLAAGTGDYSITSAVTSWTNEASQYDPNNPTASHFTQVVWKGSTQLGCAETSCAGGTIFPGGDSSQFYVCEYFPQGNVIGAFAQNVQA